MKVHYINILLFALPLNILEHNQRNHYITPHHTQANRSLCECELYAPANYDNDREMKEVMDNFDKQTQQRFHEYDERLQTKRMECKNRCDKEIEKIILKDKLEKQMAQQLTTLETKIDTNDIPTCVCEKSMSDKVEKGCLRCGGILGGGVAPSVAILGGIGIYGWKMGAPAVAEAAAKVEAAVAATNAGMREVVAYLTEFFSRLTGINVEAKQIVTPLNYKCGSTLLESVKKLTKTKCIVPENGSVPPFCDRLENIGTISSFNNYAQYGSSVYETTLTTKTTEFTTSNMATVDATTTSCQTAIIASIVAIVVIVLIMVIIYKILRYRRKKKMKKKLQYIKLLEE
ncbi:rifin PIR protein, putative [Plasmodium reichenowi]|uniref:Rifin PIR protein, putative n=1 Tax=Plasmodium reichenowi TaxID=5854 RepID=A0A2P9DCA8_PLARE|nr:rifin PIR protein, putative [Plasmodium reichenowi]